LAVVWGDMGRTIIACKIFEGLFDEWLEVDDEVCYFEIEQHLQIATLNEQLQQVIDNSSNHEVILLYGICGNATVGLRSGEHRVSILRVHDCTAVLSGGNQAFLELFGENLSQGWSSVNYHNYSKEGKSPVINNGTGFLVGKHAYIDKYGEDNGEYLWSILKSDAEIYYFTFNTIEDEETMADIRYRGKFKIIKTIEATKEVLRKALVEEDGLFSFGPNETLDVNYDFVEVFRIKDSKKDDQA